MSGVYWLSAVLAWTSGYPALGICSVVFWVASVLWQATKE